MSFFPSAPEEQEALSRERAESSGFLRDSLLSLAGGAVGGAAGALTQGRAWDRAEAKLPPDLVAAVHAGPVEAAQAKQYNDAVALSVAQHTIASAGIGANVAGIGGRLIRSVQEDLPWYVPAAAVGAPIAGSLLTRLGAGTSKGTAMAAAIGGGLISSLGGVVENYGRKSKLEQYEAARAKVAGTPEAEREEDLAALRIGRNSTANTDRWRWPVFGAAAGVGAGGYLGTRYGNSAGSTVAGLVAGAAIGTGLGEAARRLLQPHDPWRQQSKADLAAYNDTPGSWAPAGGAFAGTLVGTGVGLGTGALLNRLTKANLNAGDIAQGVSLLGVAGGIGGSYLANKYVNEPAEADPSLHAASIADYDRRRAAGSSRWWSRGRAVTADPAEKLSAYHAPHSILTTYEEGVTKLAATAAMNPAAMKAMRTQHALASSPQQFRGPAALAPGAAAPRPWTPRSADHEGRANMFADALGGGFYSPALKKTAPASLPGVGMTPTAAMPRSGGAAVRRAPATPAPSGGFFSRFFGG